MRKKLIASVCFATTLVAAVASFGCAAGGMAVTSTPATTYVTVGRKMYSCQAPAGQRPVCTQVQEL